MPDEIKESLETVDLPATPANPTPISPIETIIGNSETPAIDGAVSDAIGKHLSDNPPKRKPGRPKKFPSATDNPAMDEAAKVTVLASPANPALPVNFDEKTIETLCDGLIEMANDFAGNLMRHVGTINQCSPEVIASAADSAKMGDKTRALVKTGFMGVAKKYATEIKYVPETALCVGLSIWVFGNYLTCRTLTSKPETVTNPN